MLTYKLNNKLFSATYFVTFFRQDKRVLQIVLLFVLLASGFSVANYAEDLVPPELPKISSKVLLGVPSDIAPDIDKKLTTSTNTSKQTASAMLDIRLDNLHVSSNATTEMYNSDPALAPKSNCLSFEQALIRNAGLDPAIGEALSEQAKARARLKAIRSYGRTASGQTGLVDGRTDNQIGFILSQRIYDFGRGRYEQGAANARVNASAMGIEEVANDSSLDVAITYLSVLEAAESLSAAKRREEDLLSVAAGVKRRLETNLITAAEARSIEADRSNAIANRIEVSLELAESQSKLAILTKSSGQACEGISSIENFLKNRTPKNLDDTLQIVQQNPALRAAVQRRKAAEAELQVSRRARLPVIEAQGVAAGIYNKDLDKWEDSNRIGLDISSPLLGGRYGGQLDEAQANLRTAILRIGRLEREVNESTTLTWERINSYEELAISRRDARDSLREETNALRKEFEKGLRTYQEIKTVEADLQLSVLREIEARYLAHKQRSRLLALTDLLHNQ